LPGPAGIDQRLPLIVVYCPSVRAQCTIVLIPSSGQTGNPSDDSSSGKFAR
jgi:hypothetical protein